VAVSLKGRVTKAQSRLGDALLWLEAQRLAKETGERAETLYREGHRLAEQYGHLEVRLPGGRVDMEPMLKAMAQAEGFDYEQISAEAHRTLRALEREFSRRRNRARKNRQCPGRE
jgi:hypothetical protein